MRLNLGCGGCVPDGWINVDFSFGAKLFKIPVFKYINKKLGFFNLDWDESIKIHDLTKKFPWEDNSIKVIYSSHTLEHLSKEEGRFFLKECYRVLDDNGIIRIVVPDLEVIVKSYSNGTVSADDFLDKLGVLYRKREGYLKNMFSPFVQFPHKCMYDHKTLTSIMVETGFRVKNMKGFESRIKDINLIELEGRTLNAVIVEGLK